MNVRDVKTAVDALATAFEQFKSANDEALRQKADRDQTDPLTETKIARLNSELDNLRSSLDRTHASLSRSARGLPESKEGSPLADEHKAAFRAYLRKGDDAGLGDIERKALSVGSDPEGGYVVTREMSDQIVSTIFESSPVREFATVQSISSDALDLLVDKDEAGAGWAAEQEARAETDTPDVAKTTIPVHEIYAEPRATQKLVDDANIDIEAWLAGKVAEKFARTESTAFINGTGVGQPRGILTYPGGTGWGEIEQIKSVNASALTADGLINLNYALKADYALNGTWLMQRASVGEVRRLKDSNGQYLWQPGIGQGAPDLLLGRPVAQAADMPSVAANALVIAFGDIRRAYQIVDRIGVRVLRDPFTAKPYVKFYTTKRTGGDVVNFEAIKLQKIAA